MTELQIRSLRANDYDALIDLWRSESDGASLGLSSADEREAVVTFLGRNPGLSLGMWDGPSLVGTVLVGEDGRRGYLYHLAVRPEWRRRGLGGRLTQAALRALAGRGIHKAHVMVYAANREGRDFWRRVGFTPRQELVVLSRETSVDGEGD